MNKQLRILGKRGRITIPYAIRQRVGFAYNDVLSFTEQDDRTVVVRRERLCDSCAGQEAADTMELEGFLDALSAEQQKAALVHLSVKLTGKQVYMGKYPPLYEWSLEEAIHNNEQGLWRESYKENCDCARAIERAIGEHHHDNVLEDCVQPLIDRYGFDRVNWVLANTVQQKMEDGRFSQDNKAWAKRLYIPPDKIRWHFCVESHPGLTDLFLNQARRAWQALGLFNSSHCLSEKDGLIDYTDQVTVLKPTVLKDAFKTPEDQLFLAESGFGCSPHARGQKVFGTFLKDGEEAQFNRQDFIGVLKPEHLPDWARESLARIRATEAPEDVEAPAEDDGITMGGM